MRFLDTISVYRTSAHPDDITYDNESGRPTSRVPRKRTYYGRAFVQDDEHILGTDTSGNLQMVADARVFMPAGSHDVEIDDTVVVEGRTDWEGRVKRKTHFTGTFYTRLLVDRKAPTENG